MSSEARVEERGTFVGRKVYVVTWCKRCGTITKTLVTGPDELNHAVRVSMIAQELGIGCALCGNELTEYRNHEVVEEPFEP